MSACYLFSAMGFYPFNPCGGEYVIGTPQAPKATLRVCSSSLKSKSGIASLHSTNTDYNYFNVIANGLSKDRKYVRSVTLNGQPLDDFLRYADVVADGELIFEIGQ